MTKQDIYPIPADLAASAHIDAGKYSEMYQASVSDPEGFWRQHGQRLDWMTPYSIVKNTSYAYDNVSIKWFEDGVLNVCANCVDRHVETRGDQVAIVWEGDDPAISENITYRQLYDRVRRVANVLKRLGVGKGDRVILYMPMIPEAAYAMLACARIGAVHSIVFGGFSPDALADRINDCGAKLVVTADEGLRGGRTVPLKRNTDKALEKCDASVKCLMVNRTGGDVNFTHGRDYWLHQLMVEVPVECAPEPMNAEDPLFILYTSGSTGKPKGVLHTTARIHAGLRDNDNQMSMSSTISRE